jgi:hypothetical protein
VHHHSVKPPPPLPVSLGYDGLVVYQHVRSLLPLRQCVASPPGRFVDLHCLILAVNSALAGAQVTSIGCPGWGFLKSTSMTFGGGSPSRSATPAAFCAFAAALHVDVGYATNSRRPTATKLGSSRST